MAGAIRGIRATVLQVLSCVWVRISPPRSRPRPTRVTDVSTMSTTKRATSSGTTRVIASISGTEITQYVRPNSDLATITSASEAIRVSASTVRFSVSSVSTAGSA